MQELSGRWKLRVPKATGGAGGPRWLSAQGSGQGTGSQQTQLAQLWLTGRGSFYFLRVAVEQQVANKLGFQIWILLIRYMPCCLWPQHWARQLRAYPCLASTSSLCSEPLWALAFLPSVLRLYIPKSVSGRHELWFSFWSQQNPNPACQVTCHLCIVRLIKGHCVKVGDGRKKVEFALIAHQNKKLCLLREINVKALSLKREHRAKSLGSFISIRKRNDC